MNDPHVDNLTYVLREDASIQYRHPLDITINTPDFTGLLSRGVLTLYPRGHFETAEVVLPLAETFVRAWEIDSGLRSGRAEFHLEYGGCQLIDRKPPAGTDALHAAVRVPIGASVQVKVTRSKYPTPPASFHVTPEVEVIWDRFKRYLEQKEPLLAMAYFCLTFLEGPKRGKRAAAAARYNIHPDVLRKMGELTSERGNNLVARKLNAAQTLSESERAWIEGTIKAIIRHLAEGQTVTLAMSHLP